MADAKITPIHFTLDPIHANLDMFEQKLSWDIWSDKYKYTDIDGVQEGHPHTSMRRVVTGIYKNDTEEHAEMGYQAMGAGLWMPGGRINAGAGTNKRVTLMNCYVDRTIEDDMAGIADALKDAMLTMQQGGGIGMDFSTLRPTGAILHKTGSIASGPLPFIDMWNSMCGTIMSAGARRGAMMSTLSDSHPDLVDYINAKHTKGRWTNFNVSILISDAFMEAVSYGEDWDLYFNVPPADGSQVGQFTDDNDIIQYIYRRTPAKDLWELITDSTYEYSEPGVIFIDRINELNNLSYCEDIRCTNPCGEQPLPPNGTCNLGAVNLARMVRDPFTNRATFDWELLIKIVAVGIRFLDNVIDVTNYPLVAQRLEEKHKRRLGLGITGLANAMAQLGIRYGSSGSVDFSRKVMRTIAIMSYTTSSNLAAERGKFPAYDDAILKAPFIQKLPSELQQLIEAQGLRNGVLLTIAPTGTTSIYYGNVSSGIEPVFEYIVNRKVLQPDNNFKEYTAYDYSWKVFEAVTGNPPNTGLELPSYMPTAGELSVTEHVRIQAACQEWVDASVSKTINCSESLSLEKFNEVYRLAYDLGCKGCTTYRPSKVRGSVLSSVRDLPKSDDSPRNIRALPKRPPELSGLTYKVKWPSHNSALYVTINDVDGKPFEMFINSRSGKSGEWMTALMLMISALMRSYDDVSFIPVELQQVVSAHDSGWIEGRYYGSLVARIGHVLELHMERGKDGAASLDDLSMKPDAVVELPTVTKESCPQCEAPALIYKEGCVSCQQCGYSNCG